MKALSHRKGLCVLCAGNYCMYKVGQSGDVRLVSEQFVKGLKLSTGVSVASSEQLAARAVSIQEIGGLGHGLCMGGGFHSFSSVL